MNRRALVLVAIVLSLSVAFAVLALNSQRPSPPRLSLGSCTTLLKNGNSDPTLKAGTSAECGRAVVSNDLAVSSYTNSLTPYRTYAEASEALLVVALFACLGQIRWKVPEALRRGTRLPKAIQVLALAGLAVGLIVFALSAMLDISNFNPLRGDLPGPTSYSALYDSAAGLANAMGLHSIVVDWSPASSVQGYGQFGFAAFIGFAVAVACFVVFRAGRGVARALKDGALLAVSIIFLFELGLVILDRELMVMQVANFASVQAFGVLLVSNWFVLVISTYLLLSSVGVGAFRTRAARFAR
jgi:hypothetical protein